MASVFMKEARMMQYFRHSLSPNHQQAPSVSSVYRSATCKFSKSSGPVRYVPRVRRQTPAPRQDEKTESGGCFHSNAEEGTKKYVPKDTFKSQQPVTDPSFVEWGHLDRQQIAEANARNESSCCEEAGTCSIQPSYESHGQMTCSLELPAAQISTQGRLVLSHRSYGHSNSPSSSHNLVKMKKGGTVTCEEDNSREPAYGEAQVDTEHKEEREKCLLQSSANWAMSSSLANVPENKDTESLGDELITRECDLSHVKAKRATFLQASKRSLSLSIQDRHNEKREAAIQGKEAPPWQDPMSFLLKVQKAKQNRGLELIQMGHPAFTMDSNADLNDDGPFTNEDDRFLLLKQETFEDSKEVHEVSSYSTAEKEHAKNQAILCLSRRPYSAVDLRKKLIARSIAPSLANYAVDTIQRCGLQNDLVYAETFASARFNRASWGPQRIKLGLKQRGISDECIRAVLDKVFVEEEANMEQVKAPEESSPSSPSKMSKAAMDHLLAQAAKHWNRGKNATAEARTRRMVCWLQYRGFNYGVVKHVINHLQRGIIMEENKH